MPDDRGLDFDPGPVAASYSRIGPLPAAGPAPGEQDLDPLQFEMATELDARQHRRGPGRRPSRRIYKYG
jgi:hypothetical protein